MVLHHITQKTYGGDDSFENCIPLFLDSNEYMGKSDLNHSACKHYTECELRLYRDNWYESVRNAREGIKEAVKEDIEKLFTNEVVVLDGGTVGTNNEDDDLLPTGTSRKIVTI